MFDLQEINKLRVFKSKAKRNDSFYTKSIYPGYNGFREAIIKFKGGEYREIDPKRSKFAAAIAKGLSQSGIREGSAVLYLGASHGYTASFISDIVGKQGYVFALDFAPSVVRDLVFVCEKRDNMAPLLEDANHPERYKDVVPLVDVVFQDVAQRDQLNLFLKNCGAYLKKDGFGLLALKARSVDVTRKPKEIFREVKNFFDNQQDFVVVDYRELDPFEKDHAFFVVKKK